MSRTAERIVRVLVLLVIVLVIGAVVTLILPQFVSDTTVKVGDGVFNASVAKTSAERTKGLSGVSKLSSNQALLMVFPSDGKWQIWMKDMKIPLDIVWLNQDKKVVYIVEAALPSDSTHVIFTPKVDAKYVVELTAGTVVTKAIKLGQIASFNTITKGVH